MAISDEDRTMALEADRLRTDPSFAAAVTELRRSAVEGLIKADATDTASVMKLQAYILAIDGLCTEIANQIRRGTPREPQPVA